MALQLLRHGHQVGLQALGADVVVGLGDDAQGVIDRRPVGAAALGAARGARARPPQEADQALAMQPGERLQVVEEAPPLGAAGPMVLLLGDA